MVREGAGWRTHAAADDDDGTLPLYTASLPLLDTGAAAADCRQDASSAGHTVYHYTRLPAADNVR